MKIGNRLAASLAILLLCFGSSAARAEHHRATHLGNPATRFAPPLFTPRDLRARFADHALRHDFAAVLRQWGWTGDLADFFAAGLTNKIEEWEIPVHDTMPFMSSREAGKPVCLRNVTWAGTEPIHAYAFTFASNGRLWRCVVPKPCSNFFVEDIGPEPRAGLALDCSTPDKAILGRPFRVCLTVHNIGNIPEPRAAVSLPIPSGTAVASANDGGQIANNSVAWLISDLPAGGSKQVCAVLQAPIPVRLEFAPAASSAAVGSVLSACGTEVIGVSGMLLEKADDPDPVSIGSNTTYTVKVTNQGTAADTHVQVVVTIAPELVPVSTSAGTINGQVITLPVVPSLAPKEAVSYQVIAQGVTAGDARTKFALTSDMLTKPVNAEESTQVY